MKEIVAKRFQPTAPVFKASVEGFEGGPKEDSPRNHYDEYIQGTDMATDNLGQAASSFVNKRVAELVATVENCLADREHGESVLMPSVHLIVMLLRECPLATPPAVDVVHRWKREYLSDFDFRWAEFPTDNRTFREQRRIKITDTFDELLGIAGSSRGMKRVESGTHVEQSGDWEIVES